ncbi:hypothetical protein Hanom_Chr04g00322541 [Helianthus anomalus]
MPRWHNGYIKDYRLAGCYVMRSYMRLVPEVTHYELNLFGNKFEFCKIKISFGKLYLGNCQT